MSVRAANTTPNLTFLDARRGVSTAAIDWYGAKEQKLDDIIRRLDALDGGAPASTSINTVSTNLAVGLQAVHEEMKTQIKQNRSADKNMQIEIEENRETIEALRNEIEFLKRNTVTQTVASLEKDVSQLQV